jgi:hypothetical protein
MKARSGKTVLPCTPSLSTRVLNMVTLGISTNTRLLGLAVIKQNQLVEYKMYLHKSSWSPSKADLILTSLEPCVRQYCITRVILSIPYVHHQTEAFRQLIYRIRTSFEAKGITVFAETPEAFNPLYPTGQKKTKKVLMKALTLQFPQLSYCYKKEMRNKGKYYIKLFEAVAVAAIQEKIK